MAITKGTLPKASDKTAIKSLFGNRYKWLTEDSCVTNKSLSMSYDTIQDPCFDKVVDGSFEKSLKGKVLKLPILQDKNVSCPPNSSTDIYTVWEETLFLRNDVTASYSIGSSAFTSLVIQTGAAPSLNSLPALLRTVSQQVEDLYVFLISPSKIFLYVEITGASVGNAVAFLKSGGTGINPHILTGSITQSVDNGVLTLYGAIGDYSDPIVVQANWYGFPVIAGDPVYWEGGRAHYLRVSGAYSEVSKVTKYIKSTETGVVHTVSEREVIQPMGNLT